MPEFDIKLYDREFFQWHKDHVRDQAIDCMYWYIEKYQPKSIVDFGCGIGHYLETAYELGLKVKGYEISPDALPFTPIELFDFIEYRDCTELMVPEIGDTVISFETAEHIEPSGTNQFILNLVNATGKTLLFTGAPPGQDGTGHINCREREFWIEEFGKHLKFSHMTTGYIANAWEKLGAPWYIIKNLLVFNR